MKPRVYFDRSIQFVIEISTLIGLIRKLNFVRCVRFTQNELTYHSSQV